MQKRTPSTPARQQPPRLPVSLCSSQQTQILCFQLVSLEQVLNRDERQSQGNEMCRKKHSIDFKQRSNNEVSDSQRFQNAACTTSYTSINTRPNKDRSRIHIFVTFGFNKNKPSALSSSLPHLSNNVSKCNYGKERGKLTSSKLYSSIASSN